MKNKEKQLQEEQQAKQRGESVGKPQFNVNVATPIAAAGVAGTGAV